MDNYKVELIDLINTLSNLAHREHTIDEAVTDYSCPLSDDPYLPNKYKRRKRVCNCGAASHNKEVKELKNNLLTKIEQLDKKVFESTIQDIRERLGISIDSSIKLAKLRSAIRSGIDDSSLLQVIKRELK